MKMYVATDDHPEMPGLVSMAENYAQACEYERALELYGQAIDLLRGEHDEAGRWDQEAALHNARAVLLIQIGQWRRAQEDLGKVISRASHLADHGLLVRARVMNAEVDSFCGEYSEAVHELETAVSFALSSECTPVEKALAYLFLGTLYARIGEHDQGVESLTKACEILESQERDREVAAALAATYLQQGLDEFRQRRLDEARALYQKSLAISSEHVPNSTVEADAHRYIGILESIRGNHLEALRWHRKALQIFKQTRNPLGQAKAFNSIGQTCLDVPRRDDALFFMRKAQQICRHLGADAEMANIYGKLGTVYMEREEFDRAIESQLKDVELSRRFGNYRALAFAMRNLGLSYQAKGEPDEALHYLKESLHRFSELQDRVNVARLHLDLARSCLDRQDTVDAEEEVDKAREILVTRELGPDMGEAHIILGSIYRRNRCFEDAEKAYNQALRLLGDQPSPALAEVNFGLGQLFYEMRSHGRAVEHLKATMRLCRELKIRRLLDRAIPLLERIDDIELVNLLIEDVEQAG